MEISQITPYSTSGVGAAFLSPARSASAAYVAPVKSTYQSSKSAVLSAPEGYSVELSHSAQAKSLELSGYSVFLISIKLGLDIGTVKEYLGITDTAKSTYVPPKPAFTEPRKLTEDRKQLTQDLFQLTFAQSAWSTLISKTNSDVQASNKEVSKLLDQKINNILTIG